MAESRLKYFLYFQVLNNTGSSLRWNERCTQSFAIRILVPWLPRTSSANVRRELWKNNGHPLDSSIILSLCAKAEPGRQRQLRRGGTLVAVIYSPANPKPPHEVFKRGSNSLQFQVKMLPQERATIPLPIFRILLRLGMKKLHASSKEGSGSKVYLLTS